MTQMTRPKEIDCLVPGILVRRIPVGCISVRRNHDARAY